MRSSNSKDIRIRNRVVWANYVSAAGIGAWSMYPIFMPPYLEPGDSRGGRFSAFSGLIFFPVAPLPLATGRLVEHEPRAARLVQSLVLLAVIVLGALLASYVAGTA